MSAAQISLFVFGIYMLVIVGAGFLFAPMFILDVLRLEAGDDAWIRVVGLLASIIGLYYTAAAYEGLDRFLRWTVIGRFYAAFALVVLVVAGKLGPALLLIAAVDAAAATWTWRALRAEGQPAAP